MVIVVFLLILIFLSHLKINLLHKKLNEFYETILYVKPEDNYEIDNDLILAFYALNNEKKQKVFFSMIQYNDFIPDESFAYAWKACHESSSVEKSFHLKKFLNKLDKKKQTILKTFIKIVSESPKPVESKPEAADSSETNVVETKVEEVSAEIPEEKSVAEIEAKVKKSKSKKSKKQEV